MLRLWRGSVADQRFQCDVLAGLRHHDEGCALSLAHSLSIRLLACFNSCSDDDSFGCESFSSPLQLPVLLVAF